MLVLLGGAAEVDDVGVQAVANATSEPRWSPPSIERRAATVAVAPTPLMCSEPSGFTTAGFPVTQALFIALGLTVDKARDLELLDTFEPPGIPRVW